MAEIDHHQLPDRTTPQKRLLGLVRTLHYDETLTAPLPLGGPTARALTYGTYTLVWTDAMLTAVLGDKATAEVRGAAADRAVSGHLGGPDAARLLGEDAAGRYWRCSGGAEYEPDAPRRFFLPARWTDPFGHTTRLEHDPYGLSLKASTDPLGNRTEALVHDYRVMAPRKVRDINGNDTEVRFDALGLPAAEARGGKDGTGDHLTGLDTAALNPELPALTAFFATDDYDPAHARTLLLGASARWLFHFGEELRDGEPVWARHPPCTAVLTRERHADEQPDSPSRPPSSTPTASAAPGQEGPGRTRGAGRPAALGRRRQDRAQQQGQPGQAVRALLQPVRERPPLRGARRTRRHPAVLLRRDRAADPHRPPRRKPPARRLLALARHRPRPERHRPRTRQRLVRAHEHLRPARRTPGRPPGRRPRRYPRACPPRQPRARRRDHRPQQDRRRRREARHLHPARRGGQPALDPGSTRHPGAAACRPAAPARPASLRRPAEPLPERLRSRPRPDRARPLRARPGLRRPLDPQGRGRRPPPRLERPGIPHPHDVRRPAPPRRHVRHRDRRHDPLRSPARPRGPTGARDAGRAPGLRRGAPRPGPEPARPGLPRLRRRGRHDQRALRLPGRSAHHRPPLRPRPHRHPGLVRPRLPHRPGPDRRGRRSPARTGPAADHEHRVRRPRPPGREHRPDGSVTRWTYNEAGLPERVEVRLRGAATATAFVTGTDYDAHGRRTRVAHGNGALSTYTYDPLTFRLTGVRTTRPAGSDTTASPLFANASVVQDLHHTHDPVGNITRTEDAALATLAGVDTARDFTHDALYRLVAASGREHTGQTDFLLDPPDAGRRDYPFVGARVHPNDLQGLRGYVERYRYDAVGNLMHLAHHEGADVEAPGPVLWRRHHQYALDSNRLLSTSLPGETGGLPDYATEGGYGARYAHDAHGNTTRMPHLPLMRWDHGDRLAATARQVVNEGTPRPRTTCTTPPENASARSP
ncbi:hypothetical protein O1L60_36285 [Streptomyces diastatochromogenes]|nr:hypothetical protein [Streptomyces diastatochromogenes]